MLELLADVRGMIPALTDYEGTRSMLQHDPSSLNVVLLQEIQRYNSLLDTIKYELTDSDEREMCLCVSWPSYKMNYRCKCIEDLAENFMIL